jgi:hypothetical protein
MPTNALTSGAILPGVPLSEADGPELTFVKTLIWFDGPLLDLGVDVDKQPVLTFWLDCDDWQNTWASLWVVPEALAGLIDGKLCLLESLRQSSKVVVFETNGSLSRLNLRAVPIESLLADQYRYAPLPGAYLQFDEAFKRDVTDKLEVLRR